MDPNKPHKQIWLLDDYWDGDPCYLWCDDPAPGLDQNPDDAIGPYIYAGEIRKIVEEMKEYLMKGDSINVQEWVDKFENLTRGE